MYSKTLITGELPYSRAPTLFRSIYSQDCDNSSCVNVALEKCTILTFFLFLFCFAIEAGIIKGAIQFIVGGYSEGPWRASCPLGKVIKASWFFHISVQIIFSSTIILQKNGFIKSLPCSGFLFPIFELLKLGVLAK